jgi:hypothetical protein
LVPAFDINLDDPPEKRWLGVATFYKAELISMLDTLIPNIAKQVKEDNWLSAAKFDPEYEAELQGIVNMLNHNSVTLERLKFMNMLYEMQSPTACTGVVWAMRNGTVVHGRNMDYEFHFSVEDELKNWPDVTFDATLHRGGQPLMKLTSWPGLVGIHTGMRLSSGPGTGWSFEQNTRMPNLWRDNLAAAHQGGQIFGTTVRRIMENTPDFQSAKMQLYSAPLMAPQYFIISGSNPYEGAVLTLDRLGQHSPQSPPIQMVTNAENAWHLVQTNDDLLSYPKDKRRPLAESILASYSQDTAEGPDSMAQFMHTPELLNQATVFTTVMVPGTGYYKTILPTDLVGVPEDPTEGAMAQVPMGSPPLQTDMAAPIGQAAVVSTPVQMDAAATIGQAAQTSLGYPSVAGGADPTAAQMDAASTVSEVAQPSLQYASLAGGTDPMASTRVNPLAQGAMADPIAATGMDALAQGAMADPMASTGVNPAAQGTMGYPDAFPALLQPSHPHKRKVTKRRRRFLAPQVPRSSGQLVSDVALKDEVSMMQLNLRLEI